MHQDPLTGDNLTTQEWVAWKAQAVIRTPYFIGLFTLATLTIWFTHDPALLLWWNLVASALAIYVEWLVGTAMFGQTKRDAGYIRRIAKLEELNETQLRHLEVLLAQQETGPEQPQGRQSSVHREAPQES
jgi:hypothetical protein